MWPSESSPGSTVALLSPWRKTTAATAWPASWTATRLSLVSLAFPMHSRARDRPAALRAVPDVDPISLKGSIVRLGRP